MNFHPFFVHFPIALLTLYGVIELVPERWLKIIDSKRKVNFLLLVVGLLGAFVSLSTGEAIESSFSTAHNLVELHSLMASTATWLFGVLAYGYLINIVPCLKVWRNLEKRFGYIVFLKKLGNFFYRRPVRLLLAGLGLLAISITGALGGAIVYGPQVDPVVSFIYKLFF